MNTNINIDTMKIIVQLPFVAINREEFLDKEFRENYSDTIDAIVENGPYKAGIPLYEIHKKANASIQHEVMQASATSVIPNLPNGLPQIASLPTKAIELMISSCRIAQKLAYLSGMPTCVYKNMTDEKSTQILLYLGIMFGNRLAINQLSALSNMIASGTLNKFSHTIESELVDNMLYREFALAKEKEDKLCNKEITRGTITYTMLHTMSYRLYNKLIEITFYKEH